MATSELLNQKFSLNTFVSIDEMNKIDWSRKYTWNVFFLGTDVIGHPPSKFQGWLPATDCSLTLDAIEGYDVTGGNNSFQIPKSSSSRTFSMTLVDDINLSMTRWINDWMDVMVDISGWTRPVKDSCGLLTIAVFDSLGKNPQVGMFYVWPTNTCVLELDSSGDPIQFSVEFNIVGIMRFLKRLG